MGLQQFLLSIRRAREHPRPTFYGVLRHFAWQIRRRGIVRPYKVQITDKSFLKVESKAAVNGTTALTWTLGMYDFNNMSLIREILAAGDGPRTFLDVGANIGTYALIASEQPGVTVHAFEPHPETARILRRNLELNRRPNVTVACLALSSETGWIYFSDDAGSTVNRVLDAPSAGASGSDGQAGGLKVEKITADEYCRRGNLQPEVVKLDVEGHEREVLAGMKEILQGAGLLFLEVNHEMDELRRYVPADWKGPLKLDYVARRFMPSGAWFSREDSIFVSPAFREWLKTKGFSFPES